MKPGSAGSAEGLDSLGSSGYICLRHALVGHGISPVKEVVFFVAFANTMRQDSQLFAGALGTAISRHSCRRMSVEIFGLRWR